MESNNSRPVCPTGNDQKAMMDMNDHEVTEQRPNPVGERIASIRDEMLGTRIKAVLTDVFRERASQLLKWGDQYHYDVPSTAGLTARPDLDAKGRALLASGLPSSDIAKQKVKEGNDGNDLSWTAILVEELSEAVEEAATAYEYSNPGSYEINEDEREALYRLRQELIQVAAVTVAWIEDVDRRLIDDARRNNG